MPCGRLRAVGIDRDLYPYLQFLNVQSAGNRPVKWRYKNAVQARPLSADQNKS